MVGGSKINFDDAKPILETMGSRIVYCGDVGMGQAAKLCNNMLLAISMIGTAEAFNLGQKWDVVSQPSVLTIVLCKSYDVRSEELCKAGGPFFFLRNMPRLIYLFLTAISMLDYPEDFLFYFYPALYIIHDISVKSE